MKAFLTKAIELITPKKIDQSTLYRLEHKDKLWHLMYKTSTAVVWRSYQTYETMAEAMQDKEYFEALNKNK